MKAQPIKQAAQRLRDNKRCDRCKSKGSISCKVRNGFEYGWEWLCIKCHAACAANGQIVGLDTFRPERRV